MPVLGRDRAHGRSRAAHGGLRRERVLGGRYDVTRGCEGLDADHDHGQAGKPTEFGFKLSKTSGIAAGKVIFKVTNKGKIPHSFKICNGTKGGTANTCVGQCDPQHRPGQVGHADRDAREG